MRITHFLQILKKAFQSSLSLICKWIYISLALAIVSYHDNALVYHRYRWWIVFVLKTVYFPFFIRGIGYFDYGFDSVLLVVQSILVWIGLPFYIHTYICIYIIYTISYLYWCLYVINTYIHTYYNVCIILYVSIKFILFCETLVQIIKLFYNFIVSCNM